MRHLLTITILAAFVLALAACCGAPGAPATQASGVEIPRAAAMDPGAINPTGCTLQGGLQCGGDEIVGLQLDLPDLRPLFKVFAPLPFNAPAPARAAPAQSFDADPCAGAYAADAPPAGQAGHWIYVDASGNRTVMPE